MRSEGAASEVRAERRRRLRAALYGCDSHRRLHSGRSDARSIAPRRELRRRTSRAPSRARAWRARLCRDYRLQPIHQLRRAEARRAQRISRIRSISRICGRWATLRSATMGVRRLSSIRTSSLLPTHLRSLTASHSQVNLPCTTSCLQYAAPPLCSFSSCSSCVFAHVFAASGFGSYSFFSRSFSFASTGLAGSSPSSRFPSPSSARVSFVRVHMRRGFSRLPFLWALSFSCSCAAGYLSMMPRNRRNSTCHYLNLITNAEAPEKAGKVFPHHVANLSPLREPRLLGGTSLMRVPDGAAPSV